MPKLDPNRPFIPVRIAVLTVSDTREPQGRQVRRHAGGDDPDRRATRWPLAPSSRTTWRRSAPRCGAWIADKSIDVVITTGGTGFTGRDVTPEAVKPLFEKEIDGFSTVFHMISFEKVGTSTIQSRACAGLAHGTYIFCLPGSPGACRDAWNGILVHQLDNRHRPCNFVEIMPRLEEHRRK